MPSPALIWFRRDLRLGDNPAWFSAIASKRPLIAVYIWAPGEMKPWVPGAASIYWNEVPEPGFDIRDATIAKALKAWQAGAAWFWDTLVEAGITRGRDYPFPLVEHAPARERALAALRVMQEDKLGPGEKPRS